LTDTQLYFTSKCDDVSETSESILPLPCMELFNWFKHIKIT